jgi:hypothetical protein
MNSRYPVVVVAIALLCAACPAQQEGSDEGAATDTGVAQVDTTAAAEPMADTSTAGLGSQKGLTDDTVTRPNDRSAAAAPSAGRPRPIPSEPRPGAKP